MKKSEQPTEQFNGVKITETKNAKGLVVRRRMQTFNTEPSMTEQQFAKDADVNHIMAQYLKTGHSPFQNTHGIYADISEIPDLSQALQTVTQAQESFDSLDSSVRARFGNSPVELINFLKDDKNREEGIKLGLLKTPETAPAPISVIIANPEKPPSKQ